MRAGSHLPQTLSHGLGIPPVGTNNPLVSFTMLTPDPHKRWLQRAFRKQGPRPEQRRRFRSRSIARTRPQSCICGTTSSRPSCPRKVTCPPTPSLVVRASSSRRKSPSPTIRSRTPGSPRKRPGKGGDQETLSFDPAEKSYVEKDERPVRASPFPFL